MIVDSQTCKEIIKLLNLNVKKSLGQNFLINPNISESIVNYLLPINDEKILEIGSGLGSLTHYLSNYNTTCLEIDPILFKFLNDTYKNTNLNFINGDILKFDVSDYDMIISNLPYYITTDIVTYLLLHAKKAKRMVFMMQKEAVNRFCDTVNCKDYSPIGILISLLGKIKKEIIISKNNFYPSPNVDSQIVVIDLDINKKTRDNYAIYKMCKSLFQNKRKTILNNLTMYLKDKNKAIQLLNKNNINPLLRPENISVEEYVKLYQSLHFSV